MKRPRWFQPVTALLAIVTFAGVAWVRDAGENMDRFERVELTGIGSTVRWNDETTLKLMDVQVGQAVVGTRAKYSSPDLITCFLLQAERRNGYRALNLIASGDIDGQLRMPIVDGAPLVRAPWQRTAAWTCFETTAEEQPRLKLLLREREFLYVYRKQAVVSAGFDADEWRARSRPGRVMTVQDPPKEIVS